MQFQCSLLLVCLFLIKMGRDAQGMSIFVGILWEYSWAVLWDWWSFHSLLPLSSRCVSAFLASSVLSGTETALYIYISIYLYIYLFIYLYIYIFVNRVCNSMVLILVGYHINLGWKGHKGSSDSNSLPQALFPTTKSSTGSDWPGPHATWMAINIGHSESNSSYLFPICE